MGLASLLILKCTTRKCSFYKSFYTSAKANNSKAFEVNRRAVLATRNIGVGHQGLVKFTCVMSMLPPMNENAYRDHVQAQAAQTLFVIYIRDSIALRFEPFKRMYESGSKIALNSTCSKDLNKRSLP